MDLEIPEKRTKLENEDVTTGWFDLPFEMREMIINKMDFKVRCVFAQCSKLCTQEVKSSKRFMLNISLYRSLYLLPKHPQLSVCHADRENNFLYNLEFVEVHSSDLPKTEVIYSKSAQANDNFDKIEKWRRLENGNAEDVRARYFDDLIDEYCKQIYQIDIFDNNFPAWKYDMRKLKDIYKIRDCSGCDLLKFEVFNLSQITYADDVTSPRTNVTFEQVINLKGWHYELESDEFDEKTIAKFLKMVKKGEINANLDILKINMNLHRIPNIDTITEGLGVLEDDKIYTDDELSFNFETDCPRNRYCECTLRKSFFRVYIE